MELDIPIHIFSGDKLYETPPHYAEDVWEPFARQGKQNLDVRICDAEDNLGIVRIAGNNKIGIFKDMMECVQAPYDIPEFVGRKLVEEVVGCFFTREDLLIMLEDDAAQVTETAATYDLLDPAFLFCKASPKARYWLLAKLQEPDILEQQYTLRDGYTVDKIIPILDSLSLGNEIYAYYLAYLGS